MQMDRQTQTGMTKLIVAFYSFENAPEMWILAVFVQCSEYKTEIKTLDEESAFGIVARSL
jgi:hypothetical protein